VLVYTKKGKNSALIVGKICEGRQINGCLNSLGWVKNISQETKKLLGKL
jgi:hypothetical protein